MTLTGNPTLINPGFDAPPSDPLVLFREWLQAADKVGVCEPYAMILSTVDGLHHPSSRVVLIKEWDETGIIFGTSQNSAKGKDLQLNPWAAGTIYWRETLQQINMRGQVTQLSEERSDDLFYDRTREAQAVAASSKQSAPLMDEKALKDAVLKLINTNGTIERPEGSHAYHLALESVEFWHGGKDRFHKRLRYDLLNGTWRHQRLQP